MARKRLRILIAENVPTLNKGEATILGGIVDSLTPLKALEIHMISERPDIDKSRSPQCVEVLDINSLFPFRKFRGTAAVRVIGSILIIMQHIGFLATFFLIRRHSLRIWTHPLFQAYAESDVVMVGHDGSYMVGGGVGTPIVFYPIFAPFFGRMMGKPVVMYGGSVPPLWLVRWPLPQLFKFSLEQMELITLRERVSLENLRTLGYSRNRAFVTADPAFRLHPSSGLDLASVLSEYGVSLGDRPFVGFTLTRTRAMSAYPSMSPDESYWAHVRMIAGVIDNLVSELRATVVFIPHCIGPGSESDDRMVASDVISLCSCRSEVISIEKEMSAPELKAIMAGLDVFVGERFHSVVNALSMIVPSLMIAQTNDPRLDMLRMLGLNDVILPLEELTLYSVQKSIEWMVTNSKEYRLLIRDAIREFEESPDANVQLLLRVIDDQ